MKILLADDQFTLAKALHTRLEQMPEFQLVGVVRNCRQLFDHIQRQPPDILLLDCELPGLQDDKEQCTIVRKLRKENKQLCIIALSSRMDARQKALAAGADAFISKSDSPDYLFALLQEVQKLRHRLQAPPR